MDRGFVKIPIGLYSLFSLWFTKVLFKLLRCVFIFHKQRNRISVKICNGTLEIQQMSPRFDSLVLILRDRSSSLLKHRKDWMTCLSTESSAHCIWMSSTYQTSSHFEWRIWLIDWFDFLHFLTIIDAKTLVIWDDLKQIMAFNLFVFHHLQM